MLRFFACLALLLSFTTTSSAAPLFQTQVEQLRSQGLSERDILNHLQNQHPTPAYTGTLENAYYAPSSDRDTEGDVAPGAPVRQVHIGGTTFVDRMSDFVDAAMRKDGHEYIAQKKTPAWRFRWRSDESNWG